jgi:2-polyprenyl-6-methoxyphenol hydroxylase-like FAD-dependent oxidoreductase
MDTPTNDSLRVRCCIAGGGPAGMMLGFLLARAGIEVAVLEKHADFLRDFRGDTIHPSTLEVIHELGLLEDFLKRPHQEVRELAGWIGDEVITIADFTHLPSYCQFLAFMPQWDFLNFLADHGRRYPTFRLVMEAEVVDLLEQDGRVAGCIAAARSGLMEIRAELVVAADGRHSTVRARSGLPADTFGAPIDVLWMRLPRVSSDPTQAFGRVDAGKILVLIDRGDYWQCGYVIAKDAFEDIKRRGLPAFRGDIAAIAPFLGDRVGDLRSWEDIKLLTVLIDRLRQWCRPGLLCIGDAAHAMSPIGGVGINLAIQDAVAAANILVPRFAAGLPTIGDLQRVQQRREFPTRVTQRVQLFIQDRVMTRVLAGRARLAPPWPIRLLKRFPILRRIPAYAVGIGIRPEHVRTPDVPPVLTAEDAEAQRN